MPMMPLQGGLWELHAQPSPGLCPLLMSGFSLSPCPVINHHCEYKGFQEFCKFFQQIIDPEGLGNALEFTVGVRSEGGLGDSDL